MKYSLLHWFHGGLASVLPETISVKLDFSKLQSEKNVYRPGHINLTLEIILQCKENFIVEMLSHYNGFLS